MPSILQFETTGPSLTNITHDIQEVLEESRISDGVIHLFMQHTSASLIIQENADPDVQHDLIAYFERLAPEGGNYLHTAEGADDMPAHIRSVLTATSLSIPFQRGRLLLGTWQGVYLFEHRRHPHQRRVVAIITAEAT